MPSLSAFEALVMAALAGHMIFPILPDEATKVWTGAPPQVGVSVHVNVFLKPQVLLKELLGTKLPDVIPGVLRGACLVRALDLINLSVGNIKLQIVTLTVEAVSVCTL